jgi:hypothetical protein
VTIRHARPWGYLGRLVTTHGLPTSLAAALIAQSIPVATAYLSAYVFLRLALSWTMAVRLNDEVARRRWWLVPVWDAVAFGVGLAALVTNRIDWRGRFYQLQRGKLVVLHRS